MNCAGLMPSYICAHFTYFKDWREWKFGSLCFQIIQCNTWHNDTCLLLTMDNFIGIIPISIIYKEIGLKGGWVPVSKHNFFYIRNWDIQILQIHTSKVGGCLTHVIISYTMTPQMVDIYLLSFYLLATYQSFASL